MTRLLHLGAAAATMLLVSWPRGASAAAAQITISPTRPHAGQQVTVTGRGFCPPPCGQVQLRIEELFGPPATVDVAGDGTFTTPLLLPPVTGRIVIDATQTTPNGPITATAIVNVAASDATAGPPAAAPPPPTTAPESTAATSSTAPPTTVAGATSVAATTSSVAAGATSTTHRGASSPARVVLLAGVTAVAAVAAGLALLRRTHRSASTAADP